MPNVNEHNKLFKKIGLEEYKWVNELMDSGAKLFGPAHRAMPPHDPLSGLLLAFFKRDQKLMHAHILHNLHDLLTSPTHPTYVLEQMQRMVKVWKKK